MTDLFCDLQVCELLHRHGPRRNDLPTQPDVVYVVVCVLERQEGKELRCQAYRLHTAHEARVDL